MMTVHQMAEHCLWYSDWLAWLSASSKQGCVPNAINESLHTYHYNLQITAHITVSNSNNITVTGLRNACGANHRALHLQCRTVTPFSQQSQLEYSHKNLFTVIYCYLSCIRLCQSDFSCERAAKCERFRFWKRDNITVCCSKEYVPASVQLLIAYFIKWCNSVA